MCWQDWETQVRNSPEMSRNAVQNLRYLQANFPRRFQSSTLHMENLFPAFSVKARHNLRRNDTKIRDAKDRFQKRQNLTAH